MKFIKGIFSMMLCAALIFCLASCGSGTQTSGDDALSSDKANTEANYGSGDDYTVTNTVEINVKDYGKITVELYGKLAPITVNNFINLVNQKFYDGLTFHRIIKDFMIQGGDPNGDGTGGSSKTIKGEFQQNGVPNKLSHVRGVISMARATDPDSASSQFFIVHKDSTFLDNQYAGFGKVTSGLEVVDKIAEKVPVTDSNGTVQKSNQPVIESIKEIKADK